MSSNEKIDVIDFIINVLKEHEKNLDEEISRLEGIINTANKIKTPSGPSQKTSNIKIIMNKWNEFQEKSNKPEIVSYNMKDGRINFSAFKNNTLFIYSEDISEISMTMEKTAEKFVIRGVEVSRIEDHPLIFNGTLKCGLNLTPRKSEYKLPEGNVIQKITYEIDTEETLNWLSKKLVIEREKIIYGYLEI